MLATPVLRRTLSRSWKIAPNKSLSLLLVAGVESKCPNHSSLGVSAAPVPSGLRHAKAY